MRPCWSRVDVSAPARIHVTLCDLGRATPRAYGGVGFALETPRVEISVARGAGAVTGIPLDSAAQASLSCLSKTLSDLAGERLGIHVRDVPEQHSGVGSKTALLLAVIAAANELFRLELSRIEMQRLSGRGGTSGVGVHSFFMGGMILDGGHPQEEVPDLLPSSASTPTEIPPCIARVPMPAWWTICLMRPSGSRYAGSRELSLFAEQTPIPAQEVKEVISWVAHGLLPAVAEASLGRLAIALEHIHLTGFKAREVACQSPVVRALLRNLQKKGIAAGMSSLGPCIYALLEAGDAAGHARVTAMAAEHGAECLWTTPSNTGVRLEAVS